MIAYCMLAGATVLYYFLLSQTLPSILKYIEFFLSLASRYFLVLRRRLSTTARILDYLQRNGNKRSRLGERKRPGRGGGVTQ
jgi:hypothetical protein